MSSVPTKSYSPGRLHFLGRLGALDQIIIAARPTDDATSDPIPIAFKPLTLAEAGRTPKLTKAGSDGIRGWIEDQETIPTFNPLGATQTTGPGVPKHRLAQDLAYVATLPGETSVALNLVHYFRIPPNEKGKSYFDFKAHSEYELVAAPMSSKPAKLSVKIRAFRFWELVEHEKQKIERWKLGWEYAEPEAAARSINKPLLAKKATTGGALQFGPHPVVPPVAVAVGPDFTTYWFKILEASPWSNGIEPPVPQGDRCLRHPPVGPRPPVVTSHLPVVRHRPRQERGGEGEASGRAEAAGWGAGRPRPTLPDGAGVPQPVASEAGSTLPNPSRRGAGGDRQPLHQGTG